VHDDSIKDVVPGEPVSYREAVRRAVEESRTEESGTEESGTEESGTEESRTE
jgi:hypothetical protein